MKWNRTLVGLGITLVVIPIALLLNKSDFETYYIFLQEDGFLEWATFWSFIFAGFFFLRFAKRNSKNGFQKIWFSIGLSLFCFLFAMEEISWGQRLLGYRPPDYFLTANIQQEFNFHNFLDGMARKIILSMIIGGYGLLFPLLATRGKLKPFFSNNAIIVPPNHLIIAFASALVFYIAYPIKYTGEIVELVLGLGFMLTAIHHLYNQKIEQNRLQKYPESVGYLLATVAISILGLINAFISSNLNNDDPEMIKTTQTEVEMLHEDFLNLAAGKNGLQASSCGFHERIYVSVSKQNLDKALYEGKFAQLVEQGLPEERAQYFIDPWNMPYWVNDQCTDEGTRLLTVYSFGPDRRRQSTSTEIGGDDIGKIVHFRVEY